jgi:hypothetical protein
MIPRWQADPDYYCRKDQRRLAHLAHIEIQERINARIVMSSADGSYSAAVTRKEIEQ